MVQSLLADRFKLVVHLESDDVPVMALIPVQPGKLGPRLRPHSEGPNCDAAIATVDRSSPRVPNVFMRVCDVTNLQDRANNTVILGARHTTMDIFAAYIPTLEQLDSPIVNQTGLTGRFDIELNFTPYWVAAKLQGAQIRSPILPGHRFRRR